MDKKTDKTIYVDAAASALKPESVIQVQTDFLQNGYANSGRGVCARAAAVDKMIECVRADAVMFIGGGYSSEDQSVGSGNANSAPPTPDNIIFTSGTTDGLNRIARILELSGAIKPESTVVVSDLDHHSARLPFEELAYLGKCKLALCPLDSEFNLDAANMPKPDIFVITAMSNVMGTPQDVKEIIAAAKSKNPNVITIVDAAQYAAHLLLSAYDWDCDFLCFSGHKIGADTGVGVMYIKEPNRWAVDKLGGGMVANVAGRHLQRAKSKEQRANNSISEWTLAHGPAKFEAGTLPLTQIVGLGPAMIERSLKNIATGINRLRISAGQDCPPERKELPINLLNYLRDEFSKIPKIKFISPPGAHVLTFVVDGMHVLDFGAMMGARGVCLRVGNMCTSWLHARFGHPGTIRISTGPWNTMAEMEEVVRIVKDILSK